MLPRTRFGKPADCKLQKNALVRKERTLGPSLANFQSVGTD